jgi:uncharacterized protein YndB with AHSA1/START domain
MRPCSLLLVAVVPLFAACGGENTPAQPTTPDNGAPAQADLVKRAEGVWEGTKTLWLKYPDNPQESAARVVVSPSRIEYSWAYQDKPQTGTFAFSGSGDHLSVQWTDTWHAKDSLACTGTERDGVVKVTGTYSAGDGPDWSWRNEFRMDAPDMLNIKMYNILPDSLMPDRAERELLAVNIDLTRTPSR